MKILFYIKCFLLVSFFAFSFSQCANEGQDNPKIFSVSPSKLELSSEKTTENLTVTNLTSAPIVVNVQIENSSDWLSIDNATLNLEPNESKILVVNVNRAKLEQGKLSDTIIFTSSSQKISIPILMQVGDQDNDGVDDLVDADIDGDGLIEIYTIEDLDAIREDLAGLRTSLLGITPENFLGYELMNDLDFNSPSSYKSGVVNTAFTTGDGWKPIGDNSTNDSKTIFSSIFEGNNFTISNLYINRKSEFYIGLFGYSNKAAFNKLSLKDILINSDKSFVGGIVGFNSETPINYCSVSGSVKGYYYVGGLVGYNTLSSITNSYSMVDVNGTSSVGGLVGLNSILSPISYCYSSGNISGDEKYSNESIGGLVGFNRSTTLVGGGESNSPISNCYTTSRVTGKYQIGGLVGANASSNIRNCYTSGIVSGISRVGSLVGYIDYSTVTSSYTIGFIPGYYTGGLIGYNKESYIASYWDSSTSGQVTSDEGGVGKTTSELQNPTGYIGIYVNWAKDDPWDFGTSSQYPVLRNMPNGIAAQRP